MAEEVKVPEIIIPEVKPAELTIPEVITETPAEYEKKINDLVNIRFAELISKIPLEKKVETPVVEIPRKKLF